MEKMPRLHQKLETGINRDPSYGPVCLDIDSKSMFSQESDTKIKLSDQEYQIIWLLVRAQGAVISGSEIEDFIYESLPDDQDLPLGNTVEVRVHYLRKKLKELYGDTIAITTERGLGWKLETF